MNTLYTFGYQMIKDADKFAVAVKGFPGLRVADIRIKPFSYVVGWRKQSLQAALDDQYIHVEALGNRNYKGEYGDGVMLADADAGVRQITALLADHPVMLLCACWEVATCHRSVAADLIGAATGCPLIHLTARDVLGWLPAAPLSPEQMSLF